MDTIETMRVFVAVAQAGSFTRGAERAGIAVQTASKYVRHVEARLKVQLFDRTTRSVSLNDTGSAYLERCLDLLAQFEEVEGGVRREHEVLTGRIRVSAPTAFGERHLVPSLGSYLAAHPGITLDLHLTNRKVSLVEEGFDLAIRIGELADSSMVARRLAPMRIVVCAAPRFLAAHGEVTSPDELDDLPCIVDANFREDRQWPFRVDGDIRRFPVDGRYRVNTPQAARQLALAGVGVALCPMYVVNSDVVAGRLQILFADLEAHRFGLYAIYPHRRHLSARVRSLVDHLAADFRKM